MNNFKKLFFVLSFGFLSILVFAPSIVSAQAGTGKCTDTRYCYNQGDNPFLCISQCKLQDTFQTNVKECAPITPCTSRNTMAACAAPACLWTPTPATGAGTNALPGGTGQNANTAANINLTNPLGADSVNELVGRVINSLMGIVGSLALLMFVYGGLVWMTSSGSQDKVKKGKDILLWSAVGLIVIFGAYALTKFIISLAT